MRGVPAALAAALLCLPLGAAAHGFGRLYNLPVPFWLYGWAATAVLVLSFLLVGVLARAPAASAQPAPRDLTHHGLGRALRAAKPWLQVVSVALLLLCIATGGWGNRDPYRNFSMTFFWVVFLLAGSYLTALVGNAYAVLNPWRVLAQWLARLWPGFAQGRIAYRTAWGHWPALVLYLLFIWHELFGHGRPLALAQLLLAYTAVNVAGVWLVGLRAWFAYGEFFAVTLRLIGLMAPLHVQPGEGGAAGRLLLRAPGAGLLQERPAHVSTVVLVLALLATTAFDGLAATQVWVQLFWADPLGLITPLLGARPLQAVAAAREGYLWWQSGWLFAAPFLYLAAYLACVALAKGLSGSPRSLRQLALHFAYPLLPIAVVYHATHYATLLLTQGLKVVSLASDPFGWGWDLFGTAFALRAPILPSMGTVWHTQVGLILFGHVVSVVLSHRAALVVMPSRRAALLSQLPLLVLMVALTVAGLWILAQPLTTEMMR